MFNKPLIRQLRRENARLRADLRAAHRRYDELIEKTLFSKNPERLYPKREQGEPAEVKSAWDRAMQDAEERSIPKKETTA